MALGREWYIHTIYTVRSKDSSDRGIGKRSVEGRHHALSPAGPRAPSRSRRRAGGSPLLVREIGAESSRGTNIQHVSLDRAHKRQVPRGRAPPDSVLPSEANSPVSEVSLVMVLGGMAVGFLALGLVAVLAVVCQGRRRAGSKGATQGAGGGPTAAPQSGHGDSSEV